jgi:hypothetical protein
MAAGHARKGRFRRHALDDNMFARQYEREYRTSSCSIKAHYLVVAIVALACQLLRCESSDRMLDEPAGIVGGPVVPAAEAAAHAGVLVVAVDVLEGEVAASRAGAPYLGACGVAVDARVAV